MCLLLCCLVDLGSPLNRKVIKIKDEVAGPAVEALKLSALPTDAPQILTMVCAVTEPALEVGPALALACSQPGGEADPHSPNCVLSPSTMLRPGSGQGSHVFKNMWSLVGIEAFWEECNVQFSMLGKRQHGSLSACCPSTAICRGGLLVYTYCKCQQQRLPMSSPWL